MEERSHARKRDASLHRTREGLNKGVHACVYASVDICMEERMKEQMNE